MLDTWHFRKMNWSELEVFQRAYIESLRYPMDSFGEDHFIDAEVYGIFFGELVVGFVATHNTTLWFFYMERMWSGAAAHVFKLFIDQHQIEAVYYYTSDTLLVSLVCDLEFELEKGSYVFIDAGRLEKPRLDLGNTTLRTAEIKDLEWIQSETAQFFDHLEARIVEGTIFMLLRGTELLGCGIIEYSEHFKGFGSIGLITCKQYRQKGVGQTMVWHLKEYCYERGIQPIAGCWYYNTNSRKTLERSGMVSVVRGMKAILKGI